MEPALDHSGGHDLRAAREPFPGCSIERVRRLLIFVSYVTLVGPHFAVGFRCKVCRCLKSHAGEPAKCIYARRLILMKNPRFNNVRLWRSVALASVLALPGMAAANLKVGFIYAGPKNDAGWYSAQDQGRLYIEKNLPGLETMAADNDPETDNPEQGMERMSQA